jgi:hypothetical protein
MRIARTAVAALCLIFLAQAGCAIAEDIPKTETDCHASGGTWDKKSRFAPAGYCILDTKEMCAARGGVWGRSCAETLTCAKRYRDAWNPCSDGSDCEGGRCIHLRNRPNEKGITIGACVSLDDPCGRFDLIHKGVPSLFGKPISPNCIEKDGLSNKLSPVVLWKSIVACIVSGYDEVAIYTYALAGAFARFDTMRVADRTAHQAAQAVPMLAFSLLPKEQVAKFQARVQQTLESEETRKAYCSEIESLGPPDYVPNYMLQHGLGAFPGANNKEPFVVPFDPKAAWPMAVTEYLLCP